ncbi:MAG TPA: outer membrane protein transport protein [Thermoanaerobaculia bacterium]|nr:outer membrane protein transport protein [Thermoanaerobaculia bacterium]
MFAGGWLAAGAAVAGSFSVFQHGGRATGQAGAFVGRASDPSALSYNPAAIAHLKGLQVQAGIDFDQGVDDYNSPTAGAVSAHHVITIFPAVYVSWRPQGGPFAFGIGLDEPFWYDEDWRPLNFPGRFLTNRFQLEIGELHPVMAYDLGLGWSIGGGLRYDYGNLKQGENHVLENLGPPGPIEFLRNGNVTVDAFAWDVGVHYVDPAWGWGATYRSESNLSGTGDVQYRLPALPGATAGQGPFPDGRTSQSFKIPWEARGGIWIAPYPELRLELDVAHQNWSSLAATTITYTPNPIEGFETVARARNWHNTDSVRLGIEGEVSDKLTLFGGIGYEPSPVPLGTIEPGFARGDAYVYCAGFSVNFPRISFDAGGSYYSHRNHSVSGQERNPAIAGSYSSDDRVWSGAIRWRF